MNILIVGNGFDLSHYLPTKYDHFMDVMGAIEAKDTGEEVLNLNTHTVEECMFKIEDLYIGLNNSNYLNLQMNFNDLFSRVRDENFIKKTKKYFLTDEVLVSSVNVLKLQYRLKYNGWYKFYKKHVEDIKTWIDFEQKIEELLASFANCASDLDKIKHIDDLHKYFKISKADTLQIRKKDKENLECFEFISLEEFSVLGSIGLNGLIEQEKRFRQNLNPVFCHGGSISNGFSPNIFLDYLGKQLEEFIEIFNSYITLIVSELYPVKSSNIHISSQPLFGKDENIWIKPDYIYSFNYTNTYQRMYEETHIDYLHGRHGEWQNIVLGIADIENESFKKLKAFGFTKYHQKLFKDTDYLFLDEYKNTINQKKREADENLRLMAANALSEIQTRFIRKSIRSTESSLDLNFYIWGHSLDISDKDYIIDLFCLNDDLDRNVRVTVFYFDKPAKFLLLNNLLAILGKDKVEQWMKNKWLVFKPNPEVQFLAHENSDIDQAS